MLNRWLKLEGKEIWKTNFTFRENENNKKKDFSNNQPR
jgi:hypothetical protein